MKTKALSSRIPILDEVRGLSIILMVIYHFFFDLVILFGVDIPLFYTDFIMALVMLFAGTFIFISGASSNFSHNNLKRGAICFGAGLLLSIVTYIVMPSSFDLFGILHMLGISMMAYAVLSPLLKKIKPIIGIAIFAFLTIFTFNLPNGFLGMGIFSIDMPKAFYQTSFLFPIGLPNASFFSSDYFPLIPWFFCFLAGSFFGRLLKEEKLPKFFYNSHFSPFAFVGRYTIWIYLLHQPILYGFLWIFFNL